MTTIQVTALDSFVHGTHHVHKHALLALPESMARDLIKAGLLREGHAVAAAVAPVAAPVAKPERGKRAPANKAVAPQDNKAAAGQAGEGESATDDAPADGPAAGDAPADTAADTADTAAA